MAAVVLGNSILKNNSKFLLCASFFVLLTGTLMPASLFVTKETQSRQQYALFGTLFFCATGLLSLGLAVDSFGQMENIRRKEVKYRKDLRFYGDYSIAFWARYFTPEELKDINNIKDDEVFNDLVVQSRVQKIFIKRFDTFNKRIEKYNERIKEDSEKLEEEYKNKLLYFMRDNVEPCVDDDGDPVRSFTELLAKDFEFLRVERNNNSIMFLRDGKIQLINNGPTKFYFGLKRKWFDGNSEKELVSRGDDLWLQEETHKRRFKQSLGCLGLSCVGGIISSIGL